MSKINCILVILLLPAGKVSQNLNLLKGVIFLNITLLAILLIVELQTPILQHK